MKKLPLGVRVFVAKNSCSSTTRGGAGCGQMVLGNARKLHCLFSVRSKICGPPDCTHDRVYVEITGTTAVSFLRVVTAQDRCWASDRLARDGLLDQDSWPLCSQEEETMDHIMLRCVFSRTIWAQVCMVLGRPEWTPTVEDELPAPAWILSKTTEGLQQKNIRAILTLGLSELWKHRNDINFYEESHL